MSTPSTMQQVIAHFWSKVGKTGDDTECWLWSGKTDKDGYGKFVYCPTGRYPQRNVRAHRFALELSTDTTGDVARHSCDTPGCCNPRHLCWGSPADNRNDCVKKNRQAAGKSHWCHTRPELVRRGQRHHAAKLTDGQADEIVRRYVPRRNVGALAAEFGVTRSTIHGIGTGRDRRSSHNTVN